MDAQYLDIVNLRHACVREKSIELINRLTKKPINMRGNDSFDILQLVSSYGDDMYIFVDDNDLTNPIYIGFCVISKSDNKKVLYEFEIFKEFRNKGYGKFFAEKLWYNQCNITFNIIFGILDHAVLFWWKAIPEYFDFVLDDICEDIPHNLPKDEHTILMKKTVEEWCKKYNSLALFRTILQHAIDNYDYDSDIEQQSMKDYVESSKFWKEKYSALYTQFLINNDLL